MQKRPYYKIVKELIEAGEIDRFSAIEGWLTKDALAKPMCISYYTLENRFNNSGLTRMDEFFRLAKALEIEPSVLIKIFGPGKTGRKKRSNKCFIPSTHSSPFPSS